MYVDNKNPMVKLACDYIKNGEVIKLNELLDKGLHYDTVIIQGINKCGTLLHLACNWGHIDIVNLLIERGADINATQEINATPLIACMSEFSNPVVLRRLLELGADPRILINGDNTCLLHLAINSPIVGIREIKLIVKKCKDFGFDAVNHEDHNGMKPLHYLVFPQHYNVTPTKRFVKLTQYLLDMGTIDKPIKSNKKGRFTIFRSLDDKIGMTCEDMLRSFEYMPEVQELLKLFRSTY